MAAPPAEASPRYGERAAGPGPARRGNALLVTAALALVGVAQAGAVRSGLRDDPPRAAAPPPVELQVGQYRTVTDRATQGIVLAFTVRNPNDVPVRVLESGGPVSGLAPAAGASGAAGALPDGAPTVVPGIVEVAPGALAELAVAYTVLECGNVAQGPAPLVTRVEVGDAPPRDFFLPTPLLPSPSAGSRGEGERRPWHEVLAAQVCTAER